MEKEIFIVSEACLGTDGSVTSDAYVCSTEEEATQMCNDLIATMCNDMDIDCPKKGTFEINGEGWQYNLHIIKYKL